MLEDVTLGMEELPTTSEAHRETEWHCRTEANGKTAQRASRHQPGSCRTCFGGFWLYPRTGSFQPERSRTMRKFDGALAI